MSHDTDTNAVLLYEIRELNRRTIRLETRLFRLAKAMGHEEAMYEKTTTEESVQENANAG